MRTCAVSLDDRVLGMLMPRGSVASLVKIKVDLFSYGWESRDHRFRTSGGKWVDFVLHLLACFRRRFPLCIVLCPCQRSFRGPVARSL